MINPALDLNEYELRHVVAHLEAEERFDDIHWLLALETSEKHNAWHEIREANGDIEEYLADIRQAWQCAEKAYNATDIMRSGYSIGLQCRYVLIIASIDSLESVTPIDLRIAMIENKIWKNERAARYILQLSVQGRQLREALTPYFAGSLGEEAFTVAHQIMDVKERALALIGLVPYLSETRQTQALHEALIAARLIEGAAARANIMEQMLQHLPLRERDAVSIEALTIARTIGDSLDRAVILTKLASYLSDHLKVDVLSEAVTAAFLIEDKSTQNRVLAELIPSLPEPLLLQVLTGIRKAWTILSSSDDVLIALAPRLSESETLTVEALAIARTVGWESSRAKALVRLMPYLPQTVQDKILEEAVETLHKIDEQEIYAESQAELSSQLASSGYSEKAVEIARSIQNQGQRLVALTDLTGYLSEPLKSEVLGEALVMLELPKQRIKAKIRQKALLYLTPYLSEPLIDEALVLTLKIKDGFGRYIDLIPILCRLTELGYSERALATAQNIKDAFQRANLLEKVALRSVEPLRTEVLKEAVSAALRIKSASERVNVLTRLIVNLPESFRREVLHKVLATREIQDTDAQVVTLAKLSPHLPKQFSKLIITLAELSHYLPDQYSEVVETILHKISNSELQLKLINRRVGWWPLPAYTPRSGMISSDMSTHDWHKLPEASRKKVSSIRANSLIFQWYVIGFSLALAFVWRNHIPLPRFNAYLAEGLLLFGFPFWVILSIPQLASHLPKPLRQVILEQVIAPLVRKLPQHNMLQAFWALAWLAPRLPESLLAEALIGVWDLPIEGIWSYRRALAVLAPYLSEPFLQEILSVLKEIKQPRFTVHMLPAIIPYLSEPDLKEIMTMIQGTVPSLDVEDGFTLDKVISQSLQPGHPEEVLAAIACRLAELGYYEEALALAWKIRDKDWRNHAVVGVTSLLVAVPINTLYSFWSKVLYLLSTRDRRNVLQDLCALKPVIVALGGQPAVAETFRAIQDVVRWWP